MRVLFSEQFSRSFKEAPERVRRDFGKQLGFLLVSVVRSTGRLWVC